MTTHSVRAPVAVIVFNRPDLVAKLLSALEKVKPTVIFVIADAPRANRPDEAKACQATRALFDQLSWDCVVHRNFAETNMGCQRRVASGLDWVFENTEEAIILEDDCIPHPDFFSFCDQMLQHYRSDERVSMVTGLNYLLDQLQIEETYCFSRYYAIWGWATWKRAWQHFDFEMRDWPNQKKIGAHRAFYRQPFMQRFVAEIFDSVVENRINSWAYRWFYTCLMRNTVCIVPKVNLISNIGVSGTHTEGDNSNNFFAVFDLSTDSIRHPKWMNPHPFYDDVFFEKKVKWAGPDLTAKVFRKLSHWLRKLRA